MTRPVLALALAGAVSAVDAAIVLALIHALDAVVRP